MPSADKRGHATPCRRGGVLTLWVIVIWAMIYLPGLGTLELHGTENKRAQPAQSMVETGNYLIPHLAGKRYLAKPPLIYWLIAASYSLTNDDSEWAARLPSTLAVLAFVMVVMLSRNSFASVEARFGMSIIYLTMFGIIAKGRECEIEALYASLTGLALWLWINHEDAPAPFNPRWSLLIGVVLGLGLLTKGPLLLLFLFLPVTLHLFREKGIRELWSPGYLVLASLAIVIFLCWAIPVYRQIPPEKTSAAAAWYVQMAARFKVSHFHFGKWAGALIGSVCDFLPWALLVPFMLKKSLLKNVPLNNKFSACSHGTLLAFVLVNLMPETRARYSLPLAANISVLAGWFLFADLEDGVFWKIMRKGVVILSCALALLITMTIASICWIPQTTAIFPSIFHGQIADHHPQEFLALTLTLVAVLVTGLRLALKTSPPDTATTTIVTSYAVLNGLAVMAFFTFAPVHIKPFEAKRAFGLSVMNAIPKNAPIFQYCLDEGVGYQPFTYYIKRPIHYLRSDREVLDLPRGAFLLINENLYQGLLKNEEFPRRQPIVRKTIGYKRKTYYLIELS